MTSTSPTNQQIIDVVCDVVRYITVDWNLDLDLKPDTRLVGELGFTSMEFIELMATLDIRFQRKLPYESLVLSGGGLYRGEITIGELGHFVQTHFDVGRSDGSEITSEGLPTLPTHSR